MTQAQLASFQQWMTARFANVANGNAYTIDPNSINYGYNCIAYAINVTDRRLTPATHAALDITCKLQSTT